MRRIAYEARSSGAGRRMACRILMGIDVVVSLVFFVVVGLADGSVSSFDVALWLAALGTLAGALLGGANLHAAGKRAAAACVLAIVALPGLA